MSTGPPKTSPRNSRNAPIAAKTGDQDGPGMWTPAGGRGVTRCLPRRGFGARSSFQNSATTTRTDRTRMRTGSIAMTELQSGMTNLLVSSRIPFQNSSNIASGSVVRGTGDQHVRQDARGHAEQEQHRGPGVVDLPAGDRLHGPVRGAGRGEQEPDDDRVPRMTQRVHRPSYPLPGNRYSSENSRIQTTSTKCQYSET